MMNSSFLDHGIDPPAVSNEQQQRVQQTRNELKLVSLKELLQPLVTAVGQRQPWVDDFRDDQVMLSADLYEVIREFARLQVTAAATPG